MDTMAQLTLSMAQPQGSAVHLFEFLGSDVSTQALEPGYLPLKSQIYHSGKSLKFSVS